MSEFVRSRFFFIIVMISLSIAQGLVVHIGQRASVKLEQSLPTTVNSSLLKMFP